MRNGEEYNHLEIPSWYRFVKEEGGFEQEGALKALQDLNYLDTISPLIIRAMAVAAGFSLDDVEDKNLTSVALERAEKRKDILLQNTANPFSKN